MDCSGGDPNNQEISRDSKVKTNQEGEGSISSKNRKGTKRVNKGQRKNSSRSQGLSSFLHETRLGRSAGMFAPSRHHLRSIIDEFLEKLFEETGLEIDRNTMINFVNDKAHMSKDIKDLYQKQYDRHIKESAERYDYIEKLKAEGKLPIIERKKD